MMERRSVLALVLFLFLVNCTPAPENQITIAAAANMQFAMEEIIEEFERQKGITARLTTSSSGKLTAQIREGAPYDIFVSADLKYPEEIHRVGLAAFPPKVYARGQLALWSSQNDWQVGIEELSNPHIAHIAIANPKTAPYGIAAIQVLERLGVLEVVEDQLVYGESVSQVNQFIMTGAVEVGFTALSVLKAPRMNQQINWTTVDTSWYNPILQGVVLINTTSKFAEAEAFFDFLFTPSAKGILQKYGYLTP
jgi:molybdate transport system substrate-binding protein